MSVPDPAPARKPRRLGLYLPFILVGLLAVAWAVGWFWLKGQTERRLDLAAEQLREAGFELQWEARRVYGFPFRLNVELTDAAVREPSGWGLKAPMFESQAFVYAPDRLMFAAPEGLTFVRPIGGPVKVTGETLRASLGGLDQAPPRFSFEGVGLKFEPQAGAQPFALSAAERVEFHIRPAGEGEAAVMFKVDEGDARLTGLFGRIAGEKPISIVWDSVLNEPAALTGADWPAAVRNWTDAGGRMRVRQAGITAGDAVIGAQSGELTVGLDGRLRGSLDVSLREAPRALAVMGDQGVIPPEQALAAAAVAAAREGAGELARAELTFQAGRTTLGPVGVGPAPKVY